MPGKLPIDRVRANEDAPRIYDQERERFAKKQAKLRVERKPSKRQRGEDDVQPREREANDG